MIKRLWSYIQMMFPIHRAVPIFLLSFAVCYSTASAVAGESLVFYPGLLAGALSLVLFFLLLRVMDEFKDYEIDRRLFPDRPLITGMVTRADLTVLGWGTAIALFLLNASQGLLVFSVYLVCFLYTLLMFKFFFWPKVRERLLLALVTHNPVVFLFQCYVISFLVKNAPGDTEIIRLLPVAILLWLPWLMWEISRKIRAPSSEDAYETYSQNFGYKGACTIVTIICTLILGGSLWISQFYGGGLVLVIGIGISTAYMIYNLVGFMWSPKAGKAPLKAPVELYLLLYSISYTAVQFIR